MWLFFIAKASTIKHLARSQRKNLTPSSFSTSLVPSWYSSLTLMIIRLEVVFNVLCWDWSKKKYTAPHYFYDDDANWLICITPWFNWVYFFFLIIFPSRSKVPAFLNVVDIAGLVKGAAEGQGLGNAFLSNISACDAIFHLCRKFFF